MKKINNKGVVLIDVLIIIMIFGIMGIKLINILNYNIKFKSRYDFENKTNYFNETLVESLYAAIDSKSDIFFEDNNITNILKRLSVEEKANKEVVFEDYIVEFSKKNRGEFIWELNYEIWDKKTSNREREGLLYLPTK